MKIQDIKFMDLSLITHRVTQRCIVNAKTPEAKKRLVRLVVEVASEYIRKVYNLK